MVTRYDMLGDDWEIEEYQSGDWVKYDDYETLEDVHEELQDKYNKLVEKLGDLFREG